MGGTVREPFKNLGNSNPLLNTTTGENSLVLILNKSEQFSDTLINMPSLLQSCEDLFKSKDLYFVLGLEKTANGAQIKKAYHKVRLCNS